MAGVRRGARVALRILALTGSLRAASSNSAILRIAARLAPVGWQVEVYPGLDDLPFFNPDLDGAFDDPALPHAVRALRATIVDSDALLISSPEYAHGVSGMMKNALDWLVGGPEMVAKRVALLNTAPHATHAMAALGETLRTMSVAMCDEACVAIPVPRNRSDDELLADDSIVVPLRAALAVLCR